MLTLGHIWTTCVNVGGIESLASKEHIWRELPPTTRMLPCQFAKMQGRSAARLIAWQARSTSLVSGEGSTATRPLGVDLQKSDGDESLEVGSPANPVLVPYITPYKTLF